MKKNMFFTTATLLFTFLFCFTFAQQEDILWSEDFEGDWTQNWYVDNGVWEVGLPVGGPDSAYGGQNCAATILDDNYPANAETRLIRYTEFTVPDESENPRLRFWHWFDFDDFGGADFGRVQASISGNPYWINVSNQYLNTGSNVWSCAMVDLSDFAGLTIKISFYFYAEDIFCSPGWYIDDVTVVTGSVVCNNPERWEHGIGNWSVDMGAWETGIPTAGPDSAHHGLFCVGTYLSGNYAANVSSRLISPKFQVPPLANNPNFRFWHWFDFDDFGGADFGKLQIKVDGGSDWEDLSEAFFNTSGGAWSYYYCDISDYADQIVQIAFYIYAEDIFCGSGWYIDDIEFGGLVSNGTDFLSYSLPGQLGESQINYQDHTIFAELDGSVNLTELIATFTLDAGAMASVDGITQSSGLTANDFTNPLVYLVTSEDEITEQEWVVTIEQTIGLSELFSKCINIYPNPFSNKTTIEFNNPNQSKYNLSVFSISGYRVFEQDNITSNKIEFKRGNLPKGVYIIELQGEKAYRGKVIIN